MRRITVNGPALREKREAVELSQRGLAKLAVSRFAEPGPAAKDLANSYAHAISNLERGAATLIGTERLDALAVALGCESRDLTEPVLFGLRDEGGRLIAPGGVAVLHTSEGLAWRTIGCLIGAHGPVCAQAPTAEVVPLFASDVDRWIASCFDDLDADERAHVIALDPPPAVLRVLDCLDVAGSSTSADERHLAVTVGLVRACEVPELEHLGSPAEIALDTIEQAHDLAVRRLSCDRLRDAGRPVYAEWGRVERNLREAVDHARTLAILDDVT